jgi:hypothetical protein
MTAPSPTDSDTSTGMGFALMLETACEDYEILQRLIRQETNIVSLHRSNQWQAS